MTQKKTAKKNPWHGTEGYWISPDGKFTEVSEHFTEVKGDPGAFGFSAEVAAKWNRLMDRDRVVTAVIKKGFIRVRGHRAYTTFDIWKVTDALLSHMKRLDDKVAFYPDEDVRIHELSTDKFWPGTMRELKYLSAERFREGKEKS